MANPFATVMARRVQDRIPVVAFLASPYLLCYAGFLAIMVALSFAIPGVSSLSMSLRWPALGLVATLGILLPLVTRFRPLPTPLWLLAAFLAWMGITAIYSAEPSYTVQRTISVGMLFAATCVGVYTYCRDWSKVTRVTDLIWCIGAALVVAGIVFRASAGQAGERYEGLHNRATGAGTYAALFLPIAVYQASYRLRGVWQVLGWCLVMLFLLQTVLAGARAALVMSFAIALALGFCYNFKRAAAAGVVMIFLSPIPFFMKPDLVEKFRDKAERLARAETFSTFTGRLDRWVFGIEQWQRKPILGHGFGTSRTLAGQEDPRRFKLEPGEVFNLHSDQIEVLMDTGVVGFLPFAGFWIGLLVIGWRTVWSPRSPQRQMSLAYFGALFYAFIDTFMHGGFLAAGGGVSAFSWSMIALFLATAPGQKLLPDMPMSAAAPNSEAPPRPTPRRLAPANLPSVQGIRRPALG